MVALDPGRSICELETTRTRRRYDRLAGLYDRLEAPMERRAGPWRRELWARAEGRRILELGVGTGNGIPCYPVSAEVTAVDLSSRMLERARARAARLGVQARFELADVQRLPFAEASFDTVIATFLFCSVPDPVLGLMEARRVLVPGGKLLLLEHVLSDRPILRAMMRLMDPIAAHLWGAHLNRETVENVRRAGFRGVESTPLWLDVVQRIEARAELSPSNS
jgi:ubiquinone/menaquinone biosynthesis C-methylase UbiE